MIPFDIIWPIIIECENSNNATDKDIDKQYREENKDLENRERIAYNRIKDISDKLNNNTPLIHHMCWGYLFKDIKFIAESIRNNTLKYPKNLEGFVINCCNIFTKLDEIYRDNFNLIKEYRDNIKMNKSIEDMDKDELLEYIRNHKL